MSDRRTAAAKLATFVAAAKAKPHSRFKFADWSDPAWEIEGAEVLSNNFRRTVRFVSTEFDDAGKPESHCFKEPFGSFARAMCNRLAAARLEKDTTTGIQTLATALGHLQRQLPDDDKDPTLLLGENFSAAVDSMVALDLAPSTISHYAHKLDWAAKTMDKIGLTPVPIAWERTYFFDPESDFSSEAMEQKRMLKLLGDEDVLLWAQLSADPGPNPFDRLRQRVVDLMMCGCFRINEVLSMPCDALVCEPKLDGDLNLVLDGGGEPVNRYGLRYWPSKDHGGVSLIKAIPAVMAPVAMRALDDIKELTKQARESAIAFFQGTSPYEDWVGLPLDAAVRQDEVGHFIGFHDSGPFRRGRFFIQRHKVPYWIEENPEENNSIRKRMWVKKLDLETAVRRMSYDRVRQTSKHGRINLHDCLFVVRKRMYIDGVGTKGTAELLGYKAIEYYLRDKFPRSLALAESLPDGDNEETALYTTTHMFRFWLNTEAFEQNMSDLDVATWSGRTRLGANRRYDLRSLKAKAERLAEKLTAAGEEVSTPLEMVAESTFDGALAAGRGGHATAAGFCELHYASDPCSRVLSSAANGAYEGALAALADVDLQAVIGRLERLIAASVREQDDGRLGADKWVAANQRLLEIASGVKKERAATISQQVLRAENLS